ncbi:MAG: hypothetical protein M0R75_13640 [Dehalococcoidia bacterium]|nr:hypothetical protein [Dehalococcoidia bacterium]
MGDEALAVIEYAANLDAIWHKPNADTAAALAQKHAELDHGFALLRQALDAFRAARPTPPPEAR